MKTDVVDADVVAAVVVVVDEVVAVAVVVGGGDVEKNGVVAGLDLVT